MNKIKKFKNSQLRKEIFTVLHKKVLHTNTEN